MRATVGVIPPEPFRRRSRLFQALSAVFPVDFRLSESGLTERLDALIILGKEVKVPPVAVPTLRFEDTSASSQSSSAAGYVELASNQRLDPRLRGCRLAECVPTSVRRIVDGIPIARDERGVLWAMDVDGRDAEAAVLAPPELEFGQPLRELFQAGRFISLLPLISFLRRVSGYEEWERPAPRAVLLFDDPNLHWPSYGYIHFARLAEHARTHGYHAAIAMVPLDSWYAHRGAVRTFFDEREHLSLALHGNDHTYCELDVPLPLESGIPIFEQALQRVTRFERRTRLNVDRVMIPPHGLCSDEMLEAMVPSGIEALCRAPTWWRGWTPAARQTARWTMADMAPSGAPILSRHHLSGLRIQDEIRLDLYLDQPAIIYGHHNDLQDGYDLLADTAAWLSGFHGLEWAPLGAIARTNLMTRQEGERLSVRAFTRRATIEVPPDVTRVDLELAANDHSMEDIVVCNGRVQSVELSDGTIRAAIAMAGTESELELRVLRPPVASARPRRVRLRHAARRSASELRDRLQPAVGDTRMSTALARIEAVVTKRR